MNNNKSYDNDIISNKKNGFKTYSIMGVSNSSNKKKDTNNYNTEPSLIKKTPRRDISEKEKKILRKH